jgi:hypothetical protein
VYSNASSTIGDTFLVEFGKFVLDKLIIAWEAYSISSPRATSSPRDVTDWPKNGLYTRLIQFPIVSEDIAFGYSLEYKYIVLLNFLKQIMCTSFDVM